MKDGGPESRVWGYWLIEWKKLFSIVLLHFKDGSREAYHSHAFNSISWVLRGELVEERLLEKKPGFTRSIMNIFNPSLKPIRTTRNNMHKVISHGNTWVLSFRGRWTAYWMEYLPVENRFITFTHGRKEIWRDSVYGISEP
jgi:hypothetical protein